MGELGITEQRMNLAMTGGADLDGWPRGYLFAPRLLARDEVMERQVIQFTLTEFTGHHQKFSEIASMGSTVL